jgi:hypothetical protein
MIHRNSAVVVFDVQSPRYAHISEAVTLSIKYENNHEPSLEAVCSMRHQISGRFCCPIYKRPQTRSMINPYSRPG